MAEVSDLAALVAAVRDGAKYRNLDAGLVEAIAASEMAKGRNFKETVKATRNKLHQVAGAYFPDRPDYAAWGKLLAQATSEGEDQQRAALRRIMTNHASTRERLPFLDTFYHTILADLPPIHTILDLACGLNPLAAPWMPLAEGARYVACDIYQDQIDFINRAFDLMAVDGDAAVANLLERVPLQPFLQQPVDVALLLKTIPCLEQLDKQIGARLLAQINAPVVIVSFPARSLGGRGKGMVQNYAEHFASLVAGQAWQTTRFDFATEIVFRLSK
jgi:16S rRNA (guanine(1405)-N(7))-methyltransferase